jgi:hypothetical protein
LQKISARSAVRRWDFKEKARDYTIGATAITCEAKLATCNKKDFEWLPKGRVVSPEELMELEKYDLNRIRTLLSHEVTKTLHSTTSDKFKERQKVCTPTYARVMISD